MSLSDVWRDVGGRIGFYTKETASEIPEAAGCYAWFLPLWIYADDLPRLLAFADSVLRFDARTGNRVRGRLEFNWEALDLSVEKVPNRGLSDDRIAEWAAALKNSEQRNALAKSMMEASILMPPLYVGKADNLRARYEQHVAGNSEQANTFHRRFVEHVRAQDVALELSDLLFVAIQTGRGTNETLRDAHLNELLEKILMLLCRPPFSIR
jgi:hypothetical protein